MYFCRQNRGNSETGEIMITKLEIDNFRGHRHLEMDGISPITLVTGTNNVGKSSVLEALYLFNDHSSPGVFSTCKINKYGSKTIIHMKK